MLIETIITIVLVAAFIEALLIEWRKNGRK